MKARRTIESLVGEELNTVAFVMDYVEFHFNGPVLRAFTAPRVSPGTDLPTFPEPGSRDVLCTLIGASVQAVEVRDEEHIRLDFADGRSLTIPLDFASRVGPEAATFQGELIHSALDVW